MAAPFELRASRYSDGLVDGVGTIVGDLINDGTVAPGDPVGDLWITGSYQQLRKGVLLMQPTDATPAAYDRLHVSGNALLDGLLKLDTDGYTPVVDDLFELIDSASLSGDFRRLSGAVLGGGLRLEPDPTATQYRLRVTGSEDVTLPGAPTAVSATAADASAAITWVAPASDGGTPITDYLVTPYAGTTAGTPRSVGSSCHVLRTRRTHQRYDLHVHRSRGERRRIRTRVRAIQ